MTFNQSGWQFHDNSKVVNVTGDLHLTESGGAREFTDVLNEMRARVRELAELPEAERIDIDAQLAAATAPAGTVDGDPVADPDGEADGEPAEGDLVAGRLTRIARRLRALGGAAGAAVELGAGLDSMAQWAGQHL